MFCRKCETTAAVNNTEKSQLNRSVMERPHSGELHTSSQCPLYQVSMLAYLITTDYAGDHRHKPSVCKKNMVLNEHKKPIVLVINTISHKKLQVLCQDIFQLHYIVCRPLFARIFLKSYEQILLSMNIIPPQRGDSITLCCIIVGIPYIMLTKHYLFSTKPLTNVCLTLVLLDCFNCISVIWSWNC